MNEIPNTAVSIPKGIEEKVAQNLAQVSELVRALIDRPAVLWVFRETEDGRGKAVFPLVQNGDISSAYLSNTAAVVGDGSLLDRIFRQAEPDEANLTEAQVPNILEQAAREGWRYAWGFPIEALGMVLGAMVVFGTDSSSLSKSQSEKLLHLIHLAGLALEKLDYAYLSEKVSRFAKKLSDTSNLHHISELIVESACRFVHGSACYFLIQKSDSGEFEMQAEYPSNGDTPHWPKRIREKGYTT